MAALIAGNFEGESRKGAYAIIGGVAGAGIAIGPILGGWATTELSWRVVFLGEVVLVLFILAMVQHVVDTPIEGEKPRLDGVGSVLAASGLGLVVLGHPAVEHLGLGGTEGLAHRALRLLDDAVRDRLRRCPAVGLRAVAAPPREAHGQDPLVHLGLLKIPPLRSGLIGMLSQNLILMGIFFSIPLYLQIVLGLDALETGIKMLPVSITMFITSAVGSRLSARFTVRAIVRAGLWTTLVAAVALLATIQPTLADVAFKASMAVLGVGMGLIVSQLGNVVQSSVDASGRGEAGGLQYTGQQLGSSLGVALIGSIVLIGLGGAFVANITDDPAIADDIETQIEATVEQGIDFVPSDQVEAAIQEAGVDDATTAVIVDDYEDASLKALKVGLLAAAFLALFSLAFTGDLPHDPPSRERGRTRRPPRRPCRHERDHDHGGAGLDRPRSGLAGPARADPGGGGGQPEPGRGQRGPSRHRRGVQRVTDRAQPRGRELLAGVGCLSALARRSRRPLRAQDDVDPGRRALGARLHPRRHGRLDRGADRGPT